MSKRRQFLQSVGAFLVAAACRPEKLFGPVKKPPVSLGVSVFTGWADPRPEYGKVPGVQCPALHPWAQMRTTDRVPAIGQYNEADPAVTAWRLAQMERGGIEWVTYQHEWSPHLGQLLMNHCAENHPDDARVQFALIRWRTLRLAGRREQRHPLLLEHLPDRGEHRAVDSGENQRIAPELRAGVLPVHAQGVLPPRR